MNSNDDDSSTKSIVVENFQSPTNEWKTLNDPVMGGQSYSNLVIEDGIAKFTGKCAIVPSLQAPGFITMETGSQFSEQASKFPDISTCSAFSIQLKTNTDYEGYRISFGKAHPKGGRFAYGYKAPLTELPPLGEFGNIVIPFNKFSDKWNDATGEIEVECEDDPSYCPSPKWLQSMETMSFWGEGVEGMVDLEIKWIAVIGCDVTASEQAQTPPMMQAKIHTIESNPFYTGFAIVIIVLASIVGLCLFICYRRRSRKTFDTTPTTTSTYKDNLAELEETDVDFEIS